MKRIFYFVVFISSVCLFAKDIDFDTKLVLIGIVIQQNTQVPIPNATVVLVEMNTGSRNQVITSANGQFYFKLEVDKSYNLILMNVNGEKEDMKNISTINKSEPEVLHTILLYKTTSDDSIIKYDIKNQVPYPKEVK